MLLRKAVGPFVCAVFGALTLTAATPQPSPLLSTCTFTTGSSAITGSCGRLFDQVPRMRLRPSDAVVGGVWRSGSLPKAVWYGDMTDEGYPNPAIQLQIYSGASGILQTIYGWFPVTGYRTTSSGFVFDLDGVNEVPPNAVDARIIRRAAEIVSSTAVWNRADDRNCRPGATTYSIYCASEKAVTLADVQSLFSEALRVMTDPGWLAAHGFSTEDLGK